MRLTRAPTVRGEIRQKFSYVQSLLTFSSPPILAQVWQQVRPRLSNLPATQLSEITGMFDMYRINSFKVTVIPRFLDYDAGSNTQNPCPAFAFNLDEYNVANQVGGYDLGTYQIFMERCSKGVIHTMGDHIMSYTQKRPMTFEVDSGEVKRFPWTSTSVNNIFAYGIDFYIHSPNFPNFAATTEYNVVVELDLSLRGKR